MASKGCCLVVLLCVSCLALLSGAHPASRILTVQRRSNTFRLCGRMLVDTLAALCHSEYYAPPHHRKRYALGKAQSDPAARGNSLDYEDDDQLFGRLTKKDDGPFVVLRRGVADECCVKPCSLLQLSSYCGRNPGK